MERNLSDLSTLAGTGRPAGWAKGQRFRHTLRPPPQVSQGLTLIGRKRPPEGECQVSRQEGLGTGIPRAHRHERIKGGNSSHLWVEGTMMWGVRARGTFWTRSLS